jgi:5-carboxyvanillate decarboxylase
MTDRDYLRIATEKAFTPPELVAVWQAILNRGDAADPGFRQPGRLLHDQSQRTDPIHRRAAAGRGAAAARRHGRRRNRPADHSLTCPGVQAFDTDRAIGIATLANDQLAEACRRHPERFAGLTAVAPQDPGRAAKASRACNWSSGTSARRRRSGCTGWTTCTVPPCVPNATSASNRCSAKSVTT